MSTIASVQVRIGSTRLPGKVMRSVVGKPFLGHLLDRLQRCQYLDDVVVATSDLPENNQIFDYCFTQSIKCFRGSEDDVLGRLLGSLKHFKADTGVVVFGDCPLIDPVIVDEMILKFREKPLLDFLGNDLKTTYPPGMEVEVFRTSALEDAANKTIDPELREHGTLFIRLNPDIYNIKNVEAPAWFRRPDIHLGLDTFEDLEVLSSIFENFKDLTSFGLSETIQFLDSNPELKIRNQNVYRRWKQYRNDD